MAGLDADQQVIVDTPDGPRCIIAGPGAGKTHTMVDLVKSLRKNGVLYSDIRCVTFSNQAADTIETRAGIKGVFSTLHSLGLEICSSVSHRHIEPEIRHRLMMKLIKKWGLDYKELDLFISKMHRESISPQDILDSGTEDYGMRRAYGEYENEKANGGWMDFDDMISGALKILADPNARDRWSPKYLIVDEAQDTDNAQWRMMQLMAAKHGNITVVGDPNQAIYGFRGAAPDNLTEFTKWFPGGRYNYLGRNYRCHPPGVLIDTCSQSGNKTRPRIEDTAPIESIADGQKSITWQRRSGRLRLRGQKTITTRYFYDGPMLTISTAALSVPLTPNHDMFVRLNNGAIDKYVVYLMWKKCYGYRIGHSRLSAQQKGKVIHRLWHRIHKQKPDKLWILEVTETKHAAYVQEQYLSSKYSILQTAYLPEARCRAGLTVEETQSVFNVQGYCGALKCLNQRGLLVDKPLLTLNGDGCATLSNGFFKTAAANVIAGLMDVPIRIGDGTENDAVVAVESHAYRGPVYSLSVDKEHNYVANGIVVGNSTGNIVKFVRENAPKDTPIELLNRMVAARPEMGAPISMKMYMTDEQEAVANLLAAKKDPSNSCILARTNRIIGLYERLCARHNIRYRLLGDTGFWKQNEIRKAMKKVSEYPAGMKTETALNFVLQEMTPKYATDDRTDRDNDALENLKTLSVYTKDHPTVGDFVLYGNRMVHRKNDRGGITLSTVHQAKGGEWTNVCIAGANAKGFPHPKGDPKEEARIYFVAISRPTDFLRLTFAGTPSPYLRKYLTEEILDKLRKAAEEVQSLEEQFKLFGDKK